MLAVLLLIVGPPFAQADDGAARALFMRGELPDGKSAQPCAGCHATDGGGRKEGSLRAPAIHWEALADTPAGALYDARSLTALLAERRTPDGRSVDRVMPIVRIDDALASDLLALLKSLRQADSPGIDAQRVRIGALLAYPGDPLSTALAAAVDKWSDGGSVYGRRIMIEALDAEALRREAPTLFAVIGLTAAQGPLEHEIARAGGLNLFPRHPFAGDEDADRNRGALPDLVAVGHAIAAAAANCNEIALDEIEAAAAPALYAAFKREWRAGADAKGKCLVAFLDRAQPLGDEERLVAPLDAFVTRLPALAAHKGGATLIDIRPAIAGAEAQAPVIADVERFADAAALVLVEGLVKAGRDLTRSRFMLALDTVSVRPPAWRPLDYRLNRLSGTAETATIRLNAR